MNEAQTNQGNKIVQQIARDDGITFDAAFIVAVGVLKLHTLNFPKGRASDGSKAQATGKQADQVSD